MNSKDVNAILLISCPDKQGLVAAVTDFVYKNSGNIEDLDQHVDHNEGIFFMRLEWSLENFTIEREQIFSQFKEIADGYNMNWQLFFTDQKIKTAIFVSKPLHCLYDLLYRYKELKLNFDISLIISNHLEAKEVAGMFGIKFCHFPVNSENKIQQEEKELQLLRDNQIELVILARYMQIITPCLLDAYKNRIINIHHSFLPAFIGADPYGQAYKRGVKIIGATSHYITKDLDAGPIIQQDVVAISHKDTVADMIKKGEDLEKIVLGRAVDSYVNRKILVYSTEAAEKTVVFE